MFSSRSVSFFRVVYLFVVKVQLSGPIMCGHVGLRLIRKYTLADWKSVAKFEFQQNTNTA